jgi:hypothetical protein
MDVRLTNVLVGDARLLADGLLQPEDDMAVFVGRGGRGRVAPFTVRRSYTGAGGWYVESIALLAPNGDVPWRGREQPITLRGSNKIDTFSDDVHGVVVDYADDYELVFLIGNDEVGRVPVAVLDEDPPYADASPTAVLNEALKKGTVVWIEVPGPDGTGGKAVPAWYGTLDGRIYVLTGGMEQRIRGLDQADTVLLSARSKDLQSLLTRIEASARVVPTSDPLYGRVVPVLLPRRLNLPDGDGAVDRWRKECTLVELTPSAIPAEA